MKNNIVLIGMPGVGKSSVGVVLAKILGYRFVDSDLLIQEQEGKLLCEIMEEKGLEGFIDVENRVNASIECEKCIIATGGSVIYGEKAKIIVLDLPRDFVWEKELLLYFQYQKSV